MPRHDIAFYSIFFFLIGVLLASLEVRLVLVAIFTALLALIFFMMKSMRYGRVLALLSLLIIIGSGFYLLDDYRYRTARLPQNDVITGIVKTEPESRGNGQRFRVELSEPYTGDVLVYTDRHETVDYNDFLRIKGGILALENNEFKKYFKKDNISGVVRFAEIIDREPRTNFRKILFRIKKNALSIFERILSKEKAAFMSGITFGERAEFSEDFIEAMSRSGTTHLVALSGYNITIIALTVAGTLGYVMQRRSSFWATILVIIGFVIMTGADPSIVRAAIMGVIVLLAGYLRRVYSFRNAIAVAALLMVLHNPKVLVFDVGFQLSFFALLGIIYLKPAIETLLRITKKRSFLNWRENALTTISAQLAVLPILLSTFGMFSISAFPANILILEAIPFTMLLGFLMIAVGFIAFPLAIAIGWIANIFLTYELFLIRFFSQFDTLIIETTTHGAVLFVYAGLVVWFAVAMHKKKFIHE